MPGVLQAPVWEAGSTDSQLLIDISPREDFLPWDISIQAIDGQIELAVQYGATARRALNALSTPFSVALPGWVTVTGVAVGGAAAAMVSVVQASNMGGFMRSRILTGPATIAPGAYRYHAVTASTVDQDGTGVAVPAGGSLDITDPSALTAGDGWVEFAT